MTVELRPEDQIAIQAMVNNGHFPSVDEALHAAVKTFAEEHEAWLAYAREAIREGLEDAAAGRVVDGESFFRQLREPQHTAE